MVARCGEKAEAFLIVRMQQGKKYLRASVSKGGGGEACARATPLVACASNATPRGSGRFGEIEAARPDSLAASRDGTAGQRYPGAIDDGCERRGDGSLGRQHGGGGAQFGEVLREHRHEHDVQNAR